MPLYEYRCGACGEVTTVMASVSASNDAVNCELCGAETHRIVSRPSVHLSSRSKVRRLDPKYDKMVDQAARNSPNSDPDRLINRRGDVAKGRDDGKKPPSY